MGRDFKESKDAALKYIVNNPGTDIDTVATAINRSYQTTLLIIGVLIKEGKLNNATRNGVGRS